MKMWKHFAIGLAAAIPLAFLPSAWGLVCAKATVWMIEAEWMDANLAFALGRSLLVLPVFMLGAAAISYFIAQARAERTTRKEGAV